MESLAFPDPNAEVESVLYIDCIKWTRVWNVASQDAEADPLIVEYRLKDGTTIRKETTDNA